MSSSALLSSDFCSDEADNSPPLQLHTLKEFEQVKTFILNEPQFNMTRLGSGVAQVILQQCPLVERHALTWHV